MKTKHAKSYSWSWLIPNIYIAIALGLETTFMKHNNYSDYVSDFYLPVFPNLLTLSLTFLNLYLYQNFIDYLHLTLPTLASYFLFQSNRI